MTDANTSTDLQTAQAAQIQAITAACASAITGGFTSSALGAPYRYPTASTDQQNLSDAVMDAMLDSNPDRWTMPIWCVSSRDGVWQKVPHNIGHVKRLGRDAIQARLAMRALKDELVAQINAATTVEAVQAVVWPAGAAGATGA
jgi:hypothetical protein